MQRQRGLFTDWPQTRDATGRRLRYEHYARHFAIPEPEGGVARESLRMEWQGRSLPARRYRSPNADPGTVILYFHGGGFVVGSTQTHDSVTAHLAHHARAVVISVDYRLAPEYTAPCQLEDALLSLQWARQQYGDRARVIVAGESAGGTLAALLCQHAAASATLRIDGQLLICPGPFWASAFDGPEYGAGNTDPYLNGGDLAYYAATYAGSATASAFLPDEAGLAPAPPTLIYMAEHDPLSHQGRRYAEAIRRHQARVGVTMGAGMIHSFIRVCAVDPVAAAEFAQLCRDLNALLPATLETSDTP